MYFKKTYNLTKIAQNRRFSMETTEQNEWDQEADSSADESASE
jgi:hypothetical protein